jgi:hypothetical protein
MRVHTALWVELGSVELALAFAQKLRERGCRRITAYTPFAVPALEDVLGLERPRLLPALVLGAGLSGAALAYLIVWWTAAIDYPVDVGGRPLDSIPADIPLVFETGILSAALAAFILVVVFSGMPRLDEPVLVPGFERSSVDGFWIGLDGADPAWASDLADVARDTGALQVHELVEEVES